ncbi:gypsy/ty3 retroelement polyprotein, partial [Tanacetum coccineum]
MAPATRSIATTSNNAEEDMGARLRSVKNSLAQVTRALQELNQGMQGGSSGVNNSLILMISLNTRRFGIVFDDPISEMRTIKYQSNAKDYHDAFDTLLSRVDVSEEHDVSFYFGGLPAEIEMGVRINEFSTRKGWGNGNGYGSNVKTKLLIGRCLSVDKLPSPTANWKTKPNTPATALVRKQMTQKEYQEKRAQNLCFYYDQKYTPGHKCSGQLFSIVLLADEEWDNEEEYMEEDYPIPEEVPQVSLNALNGANYFQSLRITGKIGKHEVHVLVDCGATHNFLDVNVAKQVGCKTNKTYPLEVAVGGGRKLISNVLCKNFEWQLQGETFYTDMMILPLGGCEMVLGIQWLATLGD